MRRTVFAALIVVSGMAGLSTAAVATFDALGGASDAVRPERDGVDRTAGIGAPKVPATNAGDPASVPPAPRSTAVPSEEPAPSSQPIATDPDGHSTDERHGVLSDAFAELGLDDPSTTEIDESLPSPCTGLMTVEQPVACVLR